MTSVAVWVIIAVGVLSLIIMLHGSMFRRNAGFNIWSKLIFLGLLIFVFSEGLQLSMNVLNEKLVCDALCYLGLSLVLICLPFLIIQMVEGELEPSDVRMGILLPFPLIMMFVIITDIYHNLFYSSTSISQFEGVNFLVFDPGPAFLVLWIYVTLEFGVLIWYTIRSMRSNESRHVHVIIVIALLVPFMTAVMASLFSNSLLAELMITIAMVIAAVLVYLAISYKGPAGLTTLTMMAIMEGSNDGMLILDPGDRIVKANRTAEKYLGPDRITVGRYLKEAIPELDSIRDNDDIEIGLSYKDIDRWIHLKQNSIVNEDLNEVGSLVILTDVTEKRNYRKSLEMANRRLALLTNITAHDIQNQVMVIDGYAHLCQDDHNNFDAKIILDRVAKATSIINERIEFSKDYSQLGGRPPTWQHLDHTVASAIAVAKANGMSVSNRLDGGQVFADMLLRRVFDNLLENSIRHGDNVQNISLSMEPVSGWLEVSYADDGVGIPVEEKDAIFEMGHGSNTGIGLCLCREIMESTGASIIETGTPGEGVRFILRFPPMFHRMIEPPHQ